jgi:hypothetical protein
LSNFTAASAMDEELRNLQQVLIQGQRLSSQGTYQRRAPAKKSVPFLTEALHGLREYVQRNKNSVEAWRLLSLAEECLLHFVAARLALEKSLALSSQKNRKDLQRMAKLAELETGAKRLSLDSQSQERLEAFLESKLAQIPCDHTLSCSREWLMAEKIEDVEGMLASLRSYGGYCDCEVLMNVL